MIQWDDKYSVGISIIDEEHKKLIDIINLAIVSKEQNYNSENTKEVLNEMVECKYKQFTIEDTGMLKFNFPEYQLHRNELLNFMDSTIESYKDLAMDDYCLINETLEFLKKWFVNHIQETDKKYINNIVEKIPNILIVDDEPGMMTLLKETLEEYEDNGVGLLTAENGKEALGIIKTKKPELVILDVMMPVMNGFEVCDIIKNEFRLKNIYILILSAKSQDLDIQYGKELGADSYMTKPFDPDKLVEVVSKVLR